MEVVVVVVVVVVVLVVVFNDQAPGEFHSPNAILRPTEYSQNLKMFSLDDDPDSLWTYLPHTRRIAGGG